MSGNVLVLGANGRLGRVRDDSGLHYPFLRPTDGAPVELGRREAAASSNHRM